jgi:hypothetical protein
MKGAVRDTCGQDGLGMRRFKRYLTAFDRVVDCVEKGYYLEAIAILDSLTCERLSSRLGYVLHEKIDLHLSCGQLCARLVGTDPAKGSGSEKEPEFRKAIEEIQKWVGRRNKALHATAKVLHSDNSQMDLAAILRSHKQDAIDGIKNLQDFDDLDSKSRAIEGKYPASHPNAFFPDRRGPRSRVRTQ